MISMLNQSERSRNVWTQERRSIWILMSRIKGLVQFSVMRGGRVCTLYLGKLLLNSDERQQSLQAMEMLIAMRGSRVCRLGKVLLNSDER